MADPNKDADRGVPLSDMIETLRGELQRSMDLGHGKPVAFEIDKVELELKVAVSKKGKGEAGVAFWVVKAGASLEGQQDTVHTFKLSLKPVSGIQGVSGKPFQVNADTGPDGLPIGP